MTSKSQSNNATAVSKTGTTGQTSDLKMRLFEALDASNMTELEGIQWLRRRHEEKEQEVQLDERIEGFPLDALQCFARVLAERFGYVSLNSTPGFFGSTPPKMLSLTIDAEGNTMLVPWGQMQIPQIADGVIETYIDLYKGQPTLKVKATIKRKGEKELHNVLDIARKKLSEYSIYKGKAVSVNFDQIEDLEQLQKTPIEDFAPEFFRTTTQTLDQLMFRKSVIRQLEANLFLQIRKTEMVRKSDPDMLNRGILLAGPPGTGKSLTATHTAKMAVENGWTFVLCQAKNLVEAYKFAGRYQPAVVFCEDIDQVLGNIDPDTGEEIRDEKIDSYLNAMDSVDTKDREIITVCTTNHIERMGPTVTRHGRFALALPVLPPDADTIRRLIEWYAIEEDSHDGLSFSRLERGGGETASMSNLCQELEDLHSVPATIQEVVKRAKMYAMCSAEDDDWTISVDDLSLVVEGMREHIALLMPRPVDRRSDVEKAAARVGTAIEAAAGVGREPKPNGRSKVSLSSEAIAAFGITTN